MVGREGNLSVTRRAHLPVAVCARMLTSTSTTIAVLTMATLRGTIVVVVLCAFVTDDVAVLSVSDIMLSFV